MYAALGTSHATLVRYGQRQARYRTLLDACVQLVDDYRLDHPGGGLVKVYRYLRDVMREPSIAKLSRERFVGGMVARGRGLELTPPLPKTTQSGTVRFANHTRGVLVSRPDQVWVSDTTYYRMNSGQWMYLTFVLDVFSRVIVGFAASATLRAEANVAALQMAIAARGAARLARQETGLIFHSDGGKQYVQADFVATLAAIGATSSMGFVAQENAFAERVNGIIKNEFLRYWPASRKSLNKLELCLAHAVDVYNTKRLHDHLPRGLSPSEFERQYAAGHHPAYEVVVEQWNHDPYNPTDKFTGTTPERESHENSDLPQRDTSPTQRPTL